MGSFSMGNALGWTSPAMPHINPKECGQSCDISGVSPDVAYWIGPLLCLGATAAGPLTGPILDRFGAKATMMLLVVPLILGWVLLSVSATIDCIWVILVGRVMIGFGGGAFALSAPTYISEVVDVSKRGAYTSFMQLQVSLGVAFVNALSIGSWLDWVTISRICSAVPVALLIGLALLPESPHFLAKKLKYGEAKRSLSLFRGADGQATVEMEMEQIYRELTEVRQVGSISWRSLLGQGAYLRPLLISSCLMFVQQFSGSSFVIFYAQSIFKEASNDKVDLGLSSFLVAVCQVLGTLALILVVERAGRKPFLIASNFVMGVSLLALSVFFGLDQVFDLQHLAAVPIVVLMVYIFFFSIGMGPLAWTLNAELYSPEAKSLSSTLAFSFNGLCAFSVTMLAPWLDRAVGPYLPYSVFAAVCIFGTVFVHQCVPETKGRSAAEMRTVFQPLPPALTKPNRMTVFTVMPQ